MATGAPFSPSTDKPKTSGLAITSLILGLIGACSLGLLSIVGLILGIMASKKIKASGGAVGGRGLAIAGIIVSIITLIIGLALAATIGGGAWYGLTEAKGHAQQVMCLNNLKLLCVATINYSVDRKGQFPPADTWPEVLKEGRYISDGGILTCPGKANAGRTYAMNAKLGGMDISLVRQRGQTVLFFECSPGAPPAGDRADLPPEPPHTGGWLVGFCDGHVEVVSLNRRDQLVWDPKAE
jgi:prepilin-type processing-associated H-X9-DG protein